MKLSVSLPEDDVEFLDEYASSHGVASRSAAVQQAIALLRTHALSDSYEQAWADWEAGEDASLWEAVASDGLDGS
ncbi:MAG: ribbon-helix-helix domain-containing protein [Actinobacteria bacterium]|nr:ribbon-helix-helix domain-containing protein [Actinomycetota bacterium]